MAEALSEIVVAAKDDVNKNLQISCLYTPDDLIEFLKNIDETSGLTKSNKKKLEKIFELIRYPVTVVCEGEYVDKTYRDTYYAYFASKYTSFNKNCKRLAFFQGEVEPKKWFQYDSDTEKYLQERFIGVCILRPLKVGKIGRTVLDPAKLDIKSAYIRTTKFNFIILGHDLTTVGFTYSSQDSETMTCAEITVWNILEYFGNRYPEYRSILPSQLIGELERLSTERVLPSRGLHYSQVSELLKAFGFSPRLYARSAYGEDKQAEKAFKKTFHYYVESGIPLAVGVSGKKGTANIAHSVVCIGHGSRRKDLRDVELNKLSESSEYKYIDSADLYEEYVVMDDNRPPYGIMPFNKLIAYDDAKIDVFAVPLYRRVFLEARDASAVIMTIFKHKDIGFTSVIPSLEEPVDDKNPLVVRIFLTSSRKYRSFRGRHAGSADVAAFYSTFLFPKFVWVAEISTYSAYQKKKVYGEIVLDATAGRMSHIDSLIMVRYLDRVGYRTPSEGIRTVFDRLRHRTKSATYPYDMYESNLKECGGYGKYEEL